MRNIIITSAVLAGLAVSASAATINPIEVFQHQAVGPDFGSTLPIGPPSTVLTGGSGLSFDLPTGTGATLGQFAASGGWHADAAHAGDLLSTGPSWAIGTVFHVTGKIALAAGDVLTLTHDDGATLALGGSVVIGQPGPTPAETGSYSVPVAGNYAFDVRYGECCTEPATLLLALNGVPVTGDVGVPEPASLAVLGLGLLGMAMVRRRGVA